MKRHVLTLSLLALLAVGFTSIAFAEHGHGSAGKGQEMKMEQKMGMKNHGMGMGMGMGGSGDVIRTHSTGGMTLTYRLINMHERMKDKPGMEKMANKVASHHLMVDVKRADGGMVHDARVGFVVTGPDGKKMKSMAMAMGMEGGHGADVDMKQKGKYKVSVKIKVGEKIVKDTFTHVAE